MKKLFISLLIFLVFLFLVSVGVYFYLKTQSKNIFESRLTKLLREEVRIERVEYKFPGNFILKNIKSQSLKVKRANLDLDILKLLFKKLVFSLSLEEPVFDFKNNPVFNINPTDLQKKVLKKRGGLKILIQNLDIKRADLIYTYFELNPPLVIRLKNLNLRIRNLSLPQMNLPLGFHLSTSVLWKDSEGSFKIFGCLNYKRKDLDARIIFRDIELTYFYDYFPQVSKFFFKDLKYCFLDLKSDLDSKNDKFLIEGSVFLKRFKFKKEANKNNVKLFKTILKIFTTSENECRFDFNFQTQLSNPKINLSSLKKQVEIKLKERPRGMGERAIKAVADTVSGTMEETTKIPRKGLKILKDILKDIFQ